MKTDATPRARFAIPEMAFDCGNHAAKGAAIGIPLPWLVRGLYTYVDPDSDFAPEQLQGTTFVCYKDGDRPDLHDQAWLVGPDVRDFSQTYFRTLTTGKVESLLQILAGSLPITQDTTLEINRLICSNPHPQFNKAEYEQAVGGTHHLEVNGYAVTLIVNQVDVKPEGYGALAYGIRVGFFKPNEPVATIDIGGGTCIITAWSEKGHILDQGRITLKRGTNELVTQIVTDQAMRKLLREDADPVLVMNAIEGGLDSEGRLLYEGNEDFNFLAIFERNRKNWSQSILAEAMSVLSPWEKRIKKIGLIGGGPRYIRALEIQTDTYISADQASQEVDPNARCAILPNSQFAHVLGLISTPPEQVSAVLSQQEAAASKARNGGRKSSPANPVLPVF